MNDHQLYLEKLFELRQNYHNQGLNVDDITELIIEKEKEYVSYILEDGPGGAAAAASSGIGGGGVAYANATIGGMGAVTPSQPSSFAGATTEPAFSAGGGTVGSGDVSVPYNPGGKKKVFQKLPASMSDRKGSNNRRKNKIIQGLKNIFANKQDFTSGEGEVKKSKVMNFDNFSKQQFNKVTKVTQ